LYGRRRREPYYPLPPGRKHLRRDFHGLCNERFVDWTNLSTWINNFRVCPKTIGALNEQYVLEGLKGTVQLADETDVLTGRAFLKYRNMELLLDFKNETYF
jgi:hypothetical protein